MNTGISRMHGVEANIHAASSVVAKSRCQKIVARKQWGNGA
jgi:hypothetical protein